MTIAIDLYIIQIQIQLVIILLEILYFEPFLFLVAKLNALVNMIPRDHINKQEAHGPQIAHLNNSPCIILFRKGLLWSELWINIVKLIYFKILPYIKQYIKRRNNFIFGMFLFIVILHINWDWILSSKIPICSKKKIQFHWKNWIIFVK